jgi:hypothetical protein
MVLYCKNSFESAVTVLRDIDKMAGPTASESKKISLRKRSYALRYEAGVEEHRENLLDTRHIQDTQS